MNANKLRQEIFNYMRDEYGAMCVRVNSGGTGTKYRSNYWYTPNGTMDHLNENEMVEPHKLDNYSSAKQQTKGFPDTIIILPSGVTVYLELKTKNDRLSEEQEVFIEMAKSLGHIALAVGSVEELESQLQFYGVDRLYGVRW